MARRAFRHNNSRSTSLLHLPAPSYPPDSLNTAATHTYDFLVQVDRGVGIADDQLDLVADPGDGAWLLQFDLGVLGGELDCADGRQPARRRHCRIAAHLFFAGVENNARGRRTARYRRQYGERVRKIDVVVRAVVHIAENGAANLHFGYAGLLRTVRKGARAAAAHDRDAEAGCDAGPGTCREGCERIADGTLFLGRVGDGRSLALPPRDSYEAKTRAARDLACEGNYRRTRRNPRAIHADVHLDRHAQRFTRIREGRIELDQVLDAVDANDRVGVIGELHQPGDLDRPHDLIGDQDIADARGSHHLGLTQFGASDTDRADGDLHLRDLRRFVRLGMRPPCDAVGAAGGNNARDVGFHHVEIDQQRRRVQRGFALADQPARRICSSVHREVPYGLPRTRCNPAAQ